MDMRFGDFDRLAASEPAPIDFRVFVATIAATQAWSPAARAAAARRSAPPCAAGDETANGPVRKGAFHGATAAQLRLQRSATELKNGFTLAFQPSFKPAD